MLDEKTVETRIEQAQLKFLNLYAEALENLNQNVRAMLDSQKVTAEEVPTTDEQELEDDCPWEDEDDDPDDDDDWDTDYDEDEEEDELSGAEDEKPEPKFAVGDTVKCRICGEHKIASIKPSISGIRYYLDGAERGVGHYEGELGLVKTEPKFKVGNYAITTAAGFMVRILKTDEVHPYGPYLVRFDDLSEGHLTEYELRPTSDKPKGNFRVGQRVVTDAGCKCAPGTHHGEIIAVEYSEEVDSVYYTLRYDDGHVDKWVDWEGGYSKSFVSARAFIHPEGYDEVPF